ncbi:Ig-like domain-containing protein [Cupriavidus sp. Marseille-Q8015]
MSRNAEIIVSRQGKLLGKAVRIDSTSPAKIKAVPGARYVLKEADSDVSPENVTVRRVGDDLQVMLEGEDAPALTLEGYYALSEPSGLYGIAEDAGLYAYVPTDASTGFLALPDGQMAPLALGGEPLGPAESLIPTQSESTGLWGIPPWLLLAGAGAAIAGTVVAATSGGSGSKTPAPAPVNPQALDQVGPVQGVLTNGDVSDDTRPVITGTGIAGYTITVYDGEQVIGTTVVGADGIWRFQPEAPLGDGEHHLAVTQAGPDAPPSAPVPVVDVVIDSVPPATPAATIAGTVDGLTTNDTRPTINGTGEPGDRITVTFPGGESKTTTVAADGTWSVKADTALPDGPQDIVVSEQDPAGNTTTMTMPAVVDTEAPPTPLIDGMTDDVAPVTGPVPNGGQTNDTTPTLAGVAEPGSTIKVYDNEELIGTVTADGQGAWSFTPAQPLAEGDHAIEVTATDRAGNTSEAASYAVTVDTSAPPKPAGPLGLDQVLDDVGPIQGPIAANGVTDDRRPTFTGFGTAGETVTVYDNGQAIGRAPVAANGQWSLTPSADLAEGQHRITTTQTDLAGNESAQSDAFVFSLDITPPDAARVSITGVTDDVGTVTGNVAAGGTTDDSRPLIRGTGVAGDTIIVSTTDSTGTHEVGRATVAADGTWTLEPALPLLGGANSLRAVDMDAAGNQSGPSAPYAITLDFGKPAPPVIGNVQDNAGAMTGMLQKGDTTDDNTPTILGNAQPGSTVTLYDGTTLLGTTIADASGNFSFTPQMALADGAHGITATATNAAGQTSEATGVWGFQIDSAAPPVATEIVVTDDVGTSEGPIAPDSTTDDSRPEFSGKAEPGSTVEILDNGVRIGEVPVAEDGTWHFAPSEALADGTHALSVVVTDQAGNSSAPAPVLDITVDTRAVAVQITAVRDDVGGVTGSIAPDGMTDDKRPEIQGTGTVGATVTVLDGTTTLGTTTVDESGRWSFTPATDLADGAHAITATVTDASGTVSAPTPAFGFTLDTVAPDKGAIATVTDDVGPLQGPVDSGGATEDPQPTLAGVTEPGGRVDIYDNGQKIGTVTADAAGAWNFTPTTPLSEGTHSLETTVTDAAGNTSAKSDPYVIVTDYTPPDASRLAITGLTDDVGVVTGNVAAGATSDDASPVIRGTATAGDTIIVSTTDSTGTREIGRTTVAADGTWSLEPTLPLLSGNNALTAVEVDAAGNRTDPSAPYQVVLDFTRPPVPVLENVIDDVGRITGPLQKGDVTDDNRPTFTGTAEAGSTISIYDGSAAQVAGTLNALAVGDASRLLGTVTADASGRWSFTPTGPLADGPHTISVTATNPVGQTSDPTGLWDFRIDTGVPAMATDVVVTDDVGAVTGPITSGSTTDDSRPDFSGKAEPGSQVEILDNGVKLGEAVVGEDGTWHYAPAEALADGPHALTVVVVDPAGNVSAPTAALNTTVDTSDVVVQITAIHDDAGTVTGSIAPDASTDDVRPEIQGTGKAGSTITIFDGTTTLGTATVDGTGTWTFTPAADLTEGVHSITATARDLAGNVSAPTPALAFTVDTTAPVAAPIASLTDDVGPQQGPMSAGGVSDDAQPTLAGTVEANARVDVYNNGDRIGTVNADEAGNWTFTPPTPLPEGNHAFTITATDAAGNTSGMSPAFSIATDYTPPDASKLAINAVIDDVGTITGNVGPGTTTDDSSPVIRGTGTAGDTIIVSTTDSTGLREIGRTTVAADGTWSMEPTVPLLPGANSLSAVEMDPAGNQTGRSAPYAITLDFTRPTPPVIENVQDDVGSVVGMLQKGAVTDDARPAVIGTAQGGSTITVFDGATRLGTTTADASGNWTFTPATALADGAHNLTATATNAVGQTSEPTGVWNFRVDTAAPADATDVVMIDDVGAVTGPITAGSTTDDSRPDFSGTAEPGSKVEILDNGVKIGEVPVADDGTWRFSPPAALTDGDHSLVVVVTDPAGNSSAPTPAVNVTIDTSDVLVQISAVRDDVGAVTGNIAPNAATDDVRPEIQGTGKSGSTITVFDGGTQLGTTIVDGAGNWSFTPPTDLAQGAHSITATARDLAGNVSAPTAPFAFSIDTTVPSSAAADLAIRTVTDDVGAIQGPIANGGTTDDPQPTLSGIAEANSTVTVYDNDTRIGTARADEAGNWTFTPTTPLPEGNHAFTITATDAAGNTSAKSAPFALMTDFTAPDASRLAITGVVDDVGAVTGTVGPGATTDDASPLIQGTGTAGDTIILFTTDSTGRHEIGRATVATNGTWSMEPTLPLLPGANSLTAVEQDPAGNQTGQSAPYAISLDFTRPAPPVIENVQDDVGRVTGFLQKGDVTDDNRPAIIGTAQGGSRITIFDGSTQLGTTTADAGGNWSFTPATALTDGAHNMTATATNAVGQTSEPTGVWNFRVDTAVPAVATEVVMIDDVGAVTGPIAPGSTTDDSRPDFSGKAEPGSKVEILDNGVKIGEVTVGDDGTWSFSPPATLADGDHSMTVVVVDPAGNASAPTAPISFTTDTSSVVVQISALRDDVGSVTGNIAPNAATDDVRPEIQGTGKSGSTITVFDGTTQLGTTTVDGTGNWSFTPTADLSEGAHSITATARDLAGNVSAPTAPFAFSIDTTVPSSTPETLAIRAVTDDVGAIQGPIAAGGVTDDPQPTLSGIAEANSTVTVYDNDTRIGTARAGRGWQLDLYADHATGGRQSRVHDYGHRCRGQHQCPLGTVCLLHGLYGA